MRTSREELVEQTRPFSRIPVSRSRDILTAKNIPEDKVPRWVNDQEDRLLRFIQGGWEFVTDKGVAVGESTIESAKRVGQVISRLVGIKPGTNEPMYAYLMVISKDWYNEDQAAKEAKNAFSEAEIYNQYMEDDGSGIKGYGEIVKSMD